MDVIGLSFQVLCAPGHKEWQLLAMAKLSMPLKEVMCVFLAMVELLGPTVVLA
jgi:hypothetical protein